MIDREARIAAGELDEITPSTLVGRVEDVLDDSAETGDGNAGG